MRSFLFYLQFIKNLRIREIPFADTDVFKTNSQISYAEKSSLILDLILWLFDFCHDSAITKQALMALTAPKINCVDFCHDSAKQASLMALTAPKIENLGNC